MSRNHASRPEDDPKNQKTRDSTRTKDIVSVIIPTYNEIDNIVSVTDQVLGVFREKPYQVEILIMDDNSPDGTGTYAESFYQDEQRVRVIHRLENPGLSQAVSDGFRHARGEYCAVIDADLQHPPERLPTLIESLLNGADIAIGSRHVDGGSIENWSLTRKLVSKGAGAIAKFSLPSVRDISDPMSGFFAVRRSILADTRLEPKGYKILLEILSKCEFSEVVEVPYVFKERQRGESKLALSEYENFLDHTLGLVLYSDRGTISNQIERLVRAVKFAAVGGTGTFVNMGIFWLIASVSGYHYLIAATVAFFVAVNWNFIGNWTVTFEGPKTRPTHKLLKFYLVSLIGYFWYCTILWALIEYAAVAPIVANFISIIGVAVMNFLATDIYVFDDWGEMREDLTAKYRESTVRVDEKFKPLESPTRAGVSRDSDGGDD